MGILFYIETIIYIALTLFTRSVQGRKSIIVWRISAIISIIGLGLTIYFKLPMQNGFFVFMLLIESFILTPVLSDNGICKSCGRQVYLMPLISSKCPQCHNNIHKDI